MHDRLQLCRLCAELKTKNKLLNVNDETAKNLNLENKIKECFNLDFQNIHLPQNVCLPCCDKVETTYEFQTQVRKAQELLQLSLTDEKTNKIKEEVSDFDVEPFDYEQNVLDDDVKKEENLNDSSFRNDVDSSINSDISDTPKKTVPKRRGRKRKIIASEPKKKKERKWPQKRKRNELDPEQAIDSAERSEIIRRVKEAWKTYKWKCCICNEELPSVQNLRTHFADVHNKNPQYSCMECSKVYDLYYRFKLHHRKHRKEFNYRCHICSRFFYLKKQYEIHLEKHDPSNKKVEKQYVCALCGKSYKSSASLRGHISSFHEGKRKHKCETCSKMFKSRSNLLYHHRVHKGTRDFTCEKCGKNFFNAPDLKYHMNSAHSDAKPYCCPHCQRTFKIDRILKTHLETHSDEKRYACEICGKRFRRKGTLTRHSSVHTGILAFECEYCKKKFRTKQLLKVHIRQHTGERPYSCEECNHFFTDSSNYLKHMKSKHGVLTIRKNVTYRTDTTSVLPAQQLVDQSCVSIN